MQTNDVLRPLLSAPLAVFDEDDTKDSSRIQKRVRMHKSVSWKNSPQSIESNETDTSTRPSHYLRGQKSTSTVVSVPSLYSLEKSTRARIVRIRLVFIRIGEIDTLNEKYQADIYFEAKWTDKRLNFDALNLTPQQQTQLLDENGTVKVDELNPVLIWTPQLFIENAIGQMGERDRWFTIRKNLSKTDQATSSNFVNVDVREHRRIKGVFWEKLELKHFPADVQDLTVSIASHHHTSNCILVQDEQVRSIINREAFFDQQEWSLYQHVAIESRETNDEHSFDDTYEESGQKKHSVLAVTCRAARQPGYYYWNGFCLIFLITVCSFCIFSISPALPQSRLQITCTLLLTSVTFRWIVNRSLPQISYLTTLDIYGIASIVLLVLLCVWHSIIASIMFLRPVLNKPVNANNSYVVIDRYVFVSLITIYITVHITLIIWFFFVPYARRREMKYLDGEYTAKKFIRLKKGQLRDASKQDLGFDGSSSILDILPTIKPVRSMGHSDLMVVMSDASSTFPIQEGKFDTAGKAIDMVELREQDDEYYNHPHHIRSNQLTHTESF